MFLSDEQKPRRGCELVHHSLLTRNAMMAEHAQSGMAFAGRVTQVVTASVGLDDWSGALRFGRAAQRI